MSAHRRQEKNLMGSKTVIMNTKASETHGEEHASGKPTVALGIQSDTAFNEASRRLSGRDLCSIADLTVQEMAAIMELAHAVKGHPEDFRHALDAKQMVLFFEKASLRTRLSFEAGINTLGGNAIFVDQTQSPLGERESLADMAHNVERWMSIMVLRTYAHETITEMAACSRIPLPGHHRLLHPRRALRLRARPSFHLRRRRQQRLPLPDAHRRTARRALQRRLTQRLRSQTRNHPQSHRDRRDHRRQHHSVARSGQSGHRSRRHLH